MDFSKLQKLESVSAAMQFDSGSQQRFKILVKLNKGHSAPDYIQERARISSDMLSGEIDAGDLHRAENDPAVESISISKALPVID
ncbi:hypothetical protein IHQ71_29185 (plasmid) [Rhizobium sp. TH2]|uniref:hypothetical protein n=1 Tax=Rhizobium sp. TH2 TaxID=2775403 RepID=UPI0021570479|nr:hypothetical protein [Rhizobium sp. TH2]UVC12303.1 hypothetical protein IHQ71_29185 [Rhizobium sp. TH2]